ncbi:FMN-binding protein [Lutibacter sp.]|uniref:FMN-binding protein n=1 Tax=Lutibacter sp. TaxID=1925666 RepID=UPI0027365733|nr:FMN-binding protein [Lutibacter sp.]MDP3312604.1 FMN-binding protein [Lutibacter sp.]
MILKFKKLFVFTGILLLCMGFTLNKIDALVEKEIKATFKINSYTKEVIIIPFTINETLPLKMKDGDLMKITTPNLKGYYYIGHGFGKAAYFDFIIILDENLIVSKVKVLIYREEHGGEIGSNRWLKQFIGKTTENPLIYQKDIAAISGATISAKSLTNEVNKFLKTIQILHQKQLI